MVFNKKISGYENEDEFVRYFNNKNISAFDIETRTFLNSLFGYTIENEKLKCWKVPGFTKVDIRIKINDIVKNISIKKGVKNEVHTETVANFIELLKKSGISNQSLYNIKMYIYGDGTIDGTGETRVSVKEFKETNQNIIDYINKELNNVDLIKILIDRFIITGRISDLEVDAIIYGVTDDYIWILRSEIEKIIISKRNVYSTALHIGPLTIQSWNRNLKYNPKYEYMRDYIQVKWYNISDDIIEYMGLYREQSLANYV